MDDEIIDAVEREAEKHALINAIKHDGEAAVGAIMGPLMADNPSFRERGDEIAGIVAGVVERVNNLDTETKRGRLADLDADALAEIEATDDTPDHTLPALPNVDVYDQVRMRLAPNPNAPYHLGHARMPAVIGTYKARYDGWMLCRFDDTDPETKRPDLAAYEAILEDVDYLGFEPDDVVRASDRLETYYDHARRLIDAGGAYTCTCPGVTFSALKNDGEACPHRETDRATVTEEFEAMVDGEYSAGEMVLRVRTDLEHPNPALRDWVAFRMVDTPHPREEAAQYRCWPMLDFQSAIDDHVTGVTHIIRGIDLQDSAKRQQYVYDRFDWTYPEVIHWGHVQVDEYDFPLSASTIMEAIEEGRLDGWDDPRAPTIASLRRRGIRGDAITKAMIELGTSTSNVELSMSWIYSNNRDSIDAEANRYFLVRDGVTFAVSGGPDTGEPPLHPDHPERGTRSIPVDGSVTIEPDDVPAEDERTWLKGFGCVERRDDTFVYRDEAIDIVTDGDVPVIHWIGGSDGQSVRLRRPDGTEHGMAESSVANLDVDDIVQFERIGFARIDHQGEETVAYFAHR